MTPYTDLSNASASRRLEAFFGIGGFEERLVTPAPGRAEMFGAPVEKVRDVSWPEASAGSGASRTGAMPARRSERSQIRTEIIRPDILELAAPQREKLAKIGNGEPDQPSGHRKQSCPSIAWKLRVSAAGALSRTGRRPAAFGGLDP